MKRLQEMTPSRILITRLSAIGDCIHTIPLAVRSKELWPNCNITWVVDCAASKILSEHPAIDEVIRIERHWVTKRHQWQHLKKELRSREFDLVLDPQGLIKSSLLGWLSRAPVRIGFDYSQARELAPLLATHRIRRTTRHRVDTYLELLEPWHEITTGAAQFNMPTFAQAAATMPKMLSEMGLSSHEGFVCINPGAGWASKLWPVERYAEVASFINDNYGLKSVVVWAGEAERLMASVIVEQSSGAAICAPNTTLPELAELARRATIFLASDTGPLHLAAAMGTRCVGLFGPTWGDEVGPYGTQHSNVQSIQLPSKRGSKMRNRSNSAMQSITTQEVLLACVEMLARDHTTGLRAAA